MTGEYTAVNIKERLESIYHKLPSGVKLVAVSKFQPVEKIQEAYNSGQRLFGESRVQELLEKIPVLPSDIEWHFIGHLQTNKVKSLIGRVSLIESVDSVKLLDVIEQESIKKGVKTDVLLQVHVASEETKFGFAPDELWALIENKILFSFNNIRIRGLMAMATNTNDLEKVKNDFALAAGLFSRIKNMGEKKLDFFNLLSMGMSGDWPLAVKEGANVIRVGSYIFGER